MLVAPRPARSRRRSARRARCGLPDPRRAGRGRPRDHRGRPRARRRRAAGADRPLRRLHGRRRSRVPADRLQRGARCHRRRPARRARGRGRRIRGYHEAQGDGPGRGAVRRGRRDRRGAAATGGPGRPLRPRRPGGVPVERADDRDPGGGGRSPGDRARAYRRTRTGEIPAVTLAAAAIAGVTEVYRVGGAQAIAALAYGTESIPAVDVIVGPGQRVRERREARGRGRRGRGHRVAGRSVRARRGGRGARAGEPDRGRPRRPGRARARVGRWSS